jgi:hypothetical protein
MKQITIRCTAQATIEERWVMNVPDDFDTTDEMAVSDAFFDTDAHPGVTTEFMNEVSKDETERDIIEWSVRPLLPTK